MAERLLHFIQRLRAEQITFELFKSRDQAIMVTAFVPLERWEVEFLHDGSIAVERYSSDGLLDDEQALAVLLTKWGELSHDHNTDSVKAGLLEDDEQPGDTLLNRLLEITAKLDERRISYWLSNVNQDIVAIQALAPPEFWRILVREGAETHVERYAVTSAERTTDWETLLSALGGGNPETGAAEQS